MLEIVMPAMITNAPIMKPCDQASRISPLGCVGLLMKFFTGAMFESMADWVSVCFHHESQNVGVGKRKRAKTILAAVPLNLWFFAASALMQQDNSTYVLERT